MLHLIMEHRPPVKLVDLLILRLSELKDGFVPEDAADWRGRTPLHLAVYFGCDSTVIKRLVHGAGAVVPAVTKDATGRLPMHWACESPRGLNNKGKGTCVFRCGNRSKQCDNMVEIIEVLMEAYPHAVTVKDLSGNTPLHLAIKNGADPYTVALLERAQQKLTMESASTSSKTLNESESEVDLPVAFAEGSGFQPFDDADDMSSVGSRGVSRHHRVLGHQGKRWASLRFQI